MKDEEKKLDSVEDAHLLKVKRLFIRFLPHDPELGNCDWFKELQGKFNKDYDDLTEKEQEQVQLAYHLQSCLCWRLDYVLDGQTRSIMQEYYLDFDKEKEWQTRLNFGTYYLCGDKAISFEKL